MSSPLAHKTDLKSFTILNSSTINVIKANLYIHADHVYIHTSKNIWAAFIILINTVHGRGVATR